MANVLETLPAVAVSVPVWVELTAETVAEKLAVVALPATVTEAGTTTSVLELARVTVVPPLGAAPLSVTVHASVPDPVIDEFVQEKALRVGTLAFS